MKHYSKIILFFLIGMILCSLFLSIFGYFGILSPSVTLVISWIVLLLFSFISGMSCGKKAEKKGFLEGVKLGGLFLLCLIFLNVIFFQSPFSIQRLVYYLLIFSFSVFGSMIGINKKKQS